MGGLCTGGVIHYYKSKYIAALMDPIQGSYTKQDGYILRSCTVEGEEITDGTKWGAKVVTTGRKIKPVVLTNGQRVEIAIRVSLLVCHEPSYVAWAEKWLDGTDRSATAADDAAYAADAAATYAANAAADAGANAANAAVGAATAAVAIDAAIDAADVAANAVAAAANAIANTAFQQLLEDVILSVIQ